MLQLQHTSRAIKRIRTGSALPAMVTKGFEKLFIRVACCESTISGAYLGIHHPELIFRKAVARII